MKIRTATKREQSYIDGWQDRAFVHVNRSHTAEVSCEYNRGWRDADDGKDMPEALVNLRVRN